MTERMVPTMLSTLWTLAGVTLRRLVRGKALWIGVLLAALPSIYAVIVRGRHAAASPDDLFKLSMLLLALLPAMFVGASVGEEFEDRTTTYLWSRPIARWAVLAGKLCVLAPIVIALLVAGWTAGIVIWTKDAPSLTSCLALIAGGLATSLIAAAIATVVPKHGMAFTIGYLLVDAFIGALPFSLNTLSITHQTDVLANLGGPPLMIAAPLIAMAVVSGLWGVVGLLRIRRIET
jgi:ABC-type transport system involved in multi-copper enzyme maturation permease subunit